MRRRCDSKLEQTWLDLVDNLMLRPPSDAQYLIESCSTQPDFYYGQHNAAIYIDGPPHDGPDQIRQDEDITRRLMEMGYIVIRFHHKADWHEVFGRHPDIFGTSSQSRQDEQELAVVTLAFSKPDGTTFSERDRETCRGEGNAALMSILAKLDLPHGSRVTIHICGDGSSSYWYEVLIVGIGFVAGMPYALHQMGEAFEAGASLATGLAGMMKVSGSWLKSVAWRLSPKNPDDLEAQRPRCFGQKDQLDRRFKRCRDCGFLNDCQKTVAAVRNQ